MLRKGLLIFLIVAISVSLVFAGNTKDNRKVQGNLRPADPHMVYPINPGDQVVQKTPINTDDPIGVVFDLGDTWYDIQHNSTCGRQINVDAEGYVQIGWMNGFQEGATDRHIFYNAVDPSNNNMFGVGIPVDQAGRAGYTSSSLLSTGQSIVAYHQGVTSTSTFHTAVSYDFMAHIGAFQTVELPWVYEGGIDLEVIWPKVAVDLNDRAHVVSTENTAEGTQRIYYGWAEYNPSTMQMTVCPEQVQYGIGTVISAEVACSPVSNRVAIGYMENNATMPDSAVTQYENDLILILSDDGLTWDMGDTINLTHFIAANRNLLPDTAAANKDTLRGYAEMCLLFDDADVLHVFFTVRSFFAFDASGSWITWKGLSFIYHWDEVNQVFSMVANGWYDFLNVPEIFIDPGAWNTYVNRPSASIDPATGDIYCMYERYGTPTGVSPFNTNQEDILLINDTTDVSAAFWPNGEVWVTKSTNGGYSWAKGELAGGINVTNTQSPGAVQGACMSELTPSMAPQIYNDSLHIFYILDKDAGSILQNEGGWTNNDVIYQRVALSDIPESPRYLPFPMHCDSTNMPEDTVLAVSYNNELGVPDNFSLAQNYPNPFNPVTSISYSLNEDGFTTLKVYNISGEEVAVLVEGKQTAGNHVAEFNATDLSSGVYFYTLEMNGFTISKKMVLMK